MTHFESPNNLFRILELAVRFADHKYLFLDLIVDVPKLLFILVVDELEEFVIVCQSGCQGFPRVPGNLWSRDP